jgi:hypothetical protein
MTTPTPEGTVPALPPAFQRAAEYLRNTLEVEVPALPPLPDQYEAAAHMYPWDIVKFTSRETTGVAFSIPVGCPDGKSVPLFTADQMRAYAAQAVAAALSSLPQPTGDAWQDIESAPTSEADPFLVLRRGIAVQVSWFEGRLYPDALEACVDFDDGITDATHWMYRTQPPKETPK